ncbi:MAG: hypothetical protein N4A72_13540 [Bacteroidales bacterium]|jgi:hypothetical protein|nr:hypothetical protein [Bacteroidales bacterium]
MKLNWQERLKDKSNKELITLFSETDRINIEPQLCAGNLLYTRDYKTEELRTIKEKLKQTIEQNFNNRYYTNPKHIITENIVKIIVLNLMFIGFALFASVIVSEIVKYYLYPWAIILVSVLVIVKLLFIKRSNRRAIKKVERARANKDELIKHIENELRF